MMISVKVKTNAKKNDVICISNDTFEVKTTTTPENGKANKSVVELLSQYFKVSKNSIVILKGSRSHNKIIEIKQ